MDNELPKNRVLHLCNIGSGSRELDLNDGKILTQIKVAFIICAFNIRDEGLNVRQSRL